jgi:hypothetical protein
MAGQPPVYRVDAAGMGRNELLDLFLRQMLSVAHMGRITDLYEVPLQLMEAELGQRDVQLDDVRSRGAAHLGPAARRSDTLAKLEVMGAGGGYECQDECEEERKLRERTHGDEPPSLEPTDGGDSLGIYAAWCGQAILVWKRKGNTVATSVYTRLAPPWRLSMTDAPPSSSAVA